VIALDTEGSGDEGATMIGGPGATPMVAMLDEDLSAAPLGAGALLPAQPGLAHPAWVFDAQMPGMPMAAPEEMVAAPGLPETPYSVLNVTGLAACVALLSVAGMMMFDLLRNMWSWEGTYTINSSLMDMLVGLFDK